jgi:hypothetical protein
MFFGEWFTKFDKEPSRDERFVTSALVPKALRSKQVGCPCPSKPEEPPLFPAAFQLSLSTDFRFMSHDNSASIVSKVWNYAHVLRSTTATPRRRSLFLLFGSKVCASADSLPKPSAPLEEQRAPEYPLRVPDSSK